MNQSLFTVQNEVLQASTVISSTSNGANIRRTSTSRVVEIWINVTVVTGSGNIDYVIKTSINGTDFFAESTVAAVVATGMNKVIFNRADNALGTHLRVDFVLNSGTSHTTEINMIRME